MRKSKLARTYQQHLGGPQGEIILRDLMQRCGISRTSAQTTDEKLVFFNEGRRSIALEILALMKVNVAEAIKAEEVNDERRERTVRDPWELEGTNPGGVSGSGGTV